MAARFSDELRATADDIWAAQHAHPFVRGIGDGSLDPDAFRHYVRQDYLFLIDYARLLALGCARAPRLDWMRRLAELVSSILVEEMDLHRAFAAEWGIDPEELAAERPTPTTRAYCDFLLRTAALGDFDELLAALLPCMWAYHEIGVELAAGPAPADDRYARWIAMYASQDFGRLAVWCREVVDELGTAADGERRAAMRAAFVTSSRHELAFWEMARRREPPEPA